MFDKPPAGRQFFVDDSDEEAADVLTRGHSIPRKGKEKALSDNAEESANLLYASTFVSP